MSQLTYQHTVNPEAYEMRQTSYLAQGSNPDWTHYFYYALWEDFFLPIFVHVLKYVKCVVIEKNEKMPGFATHNAFEAALMYPEKVFISRLLELVYLKSLSMAKAILGSLLAEKLLRYLWSREAFPNYFWQWRRWKLKSWSRSSQFVAISVTRC